MQHICKDQTYSMSFAKLHTIATNRSHADTILWKKRPSVSSTIMFFTVYMIAVYLHVDADDGGPRKLVERITKNVRVCSFIYNAEAYAAKNKMCHVSMGLTEDSVQNSDYVLYEPLKLLKMLIGTSCSLKLLAYFCL